MRITAQYDSWCPRCFRSIKRGQRIEWHFGLKPYHINCPKDQDSLGYQSNQSNSEGEKRDHEEINIE